MARIVTKDEIKAMQAELARLGFYTDTVDGDFGPKTEDAVELAQEHFGQTVTGRPTLELLAELRVIAQPITIEKPNPLTSFLTGLAVKAVLSKIIGVPAMTFLSGYKTYILAVLIILSAAAETFVGVDIPGFSMGLGEAFAVGLALITGRHGAKVDVAKIQ